MTASSLHSPRHSCSLTDSWLCRWTDTSVRTGRKSWWLDERCCVGWVFARVARVACSSYVVKSCEGTRELTRSLKYLKQAILARSALVSSPHSEWTRTLRVSKTGNGYRERPTCKQYSKAAKRCLRALVSEVCRAWHACGSVYVSCFKIPSEIYWPDTDRQLIVSCWTLDLLPLSGSRCTYRVLDVVVLHNCSRLEYTWSSFFLEGLT